MGATILLVGLLATLVTAPLFDRVLTHQLARTCKCLSPVVGVAWLSLIWASKSRIMHDSKSGADALP